MKWAAKLVIISLASGLFSSVCPSNAKKYVDGAFTFLFLMVILSPFRTAENFDAKAILHSVSEKAQASFSDDTVSAIRADALEDHIESGVLALGYECKAEIAAEKTDGKLFCTDCILYFGEEMPGNDLGSVLKFVSSQTGMDAGDIQIVYSFGER